MKKIYFAVLGLLVLLITSCGDSFLQSNATTQIPQEEYYANETELLSGLMAAYAPLQWPDYTGQYNPLPFVSDVMSDDVAVGGSGETDQANLHYMGRFGATPNYVCSDLWTVVFYSGINRANLVINNIDNAKNISNSSKNRILAEARTLRAYYYFWLWKLWGNVPYYSVNPSTPPYIVPQMKADSVYEKIIGDLDFAIKGNYLPATVATNELGRFTKAAAQMLKADAVMYQNDTKRYPEVLTDLREIINSGLYSLTSDFASIWEDAGEWNSESIFEVNYSDQSSTRGWGNALGTGGTVYPSLIGINGLTGDSIYDGGWGFEPVEKSLYDAYDVADQRKDGGILYFAKYKQEHPGVSYSGRYEDTGCFNRKYLPRKGGNSKCQGDVALNYRNNYRVYRFSETLLRAAELIVRTGGDQTEADKYLNMVRARAYKMKIDDPAFQVYKETATLDNLLQEYRLEFACEGHRFWDLVRFGKAESVLGYKGYVSNKKYLPIPQTEIDKAQGTLKQNPY